MRRNTKRRVFLAIGCAQVGPTACKICSQILKVVLRKTRRTERACRDREAAAPSPHGKRTAASAVSATA